MPDLSSRMNLRAKILKMLLKYRDNKNHSSDEISQDIIQLKSIKDKEYTARLLFKEIAAASSDDFVNICAIMLLEAIDKDIFEKYAFEFLKDKSNSDEKKFFIISLIKQKGVYFDYETVDLYIQNPQQAAQNGVKDFLSDIIYDPEVQIDLLDFFINIPPSERLCFLNNIFEEDDADGISCAMSIILQSDINKEEFNLIKDYLLQANSLYAVEGLNYILQKSDTDLKLRNKIKNKIKNIKKENSDCMECIIKKSKIHNCYISFIDGHSNFSLILSRKTQEKSIDTLLLSINTKVGITACMGFGNITQLNFSTIIKRLFPDSIPVKITPVALKVIYKHYRNKNQTTKTPFPYELIVWEKLLYDIQDVDSDISDFVKSKLDLIAMDKSKFNRFLSSKVIESWYFSYGQNKSIDKLIDIIEGNHIIEYEKINKLISDNIIKDFIDNKEFKTEIIDRLLLCSYISKLANLKITSSVAYSLCFQKEYFKMFVEYIIEKSLYEYFTDISEEIIAQSQGNIFKRKNETKFNFGELNNLMTEIEEKWT